MFGGCKSDKLNSADLKKGFLAEPGFKTSCEILDKLSGPDYERAMVQMSRMRRSSPHFAYISEEANRDSRNIYEEACREVLGKV